MAYFPFFMDISGSAGLIVGGGAVARRKVEKLLPYGPSLTVVAPEIIPELSAMHELTLRPRAFLPGDLDGQAFVVAATGDPELNRRVSALCKAKNIPVNVADDKDACSFLFPCLIRRGELSIGISTAGASPTAAIYIRDLIAGALPACLPRVMDYLNTLRAGIRESVPDEQRRAALFSRLFRLCMELERPLTDAELRAAMRDKDTEGLT